MMYLIKLASAVSVMVAIIIISGCDNSSQVSNSVQQQTVHVGTDQPVNTGNVVVLENKIQEAKNGTNRIGSSNVSSQAALLPDTGNEKPPFIAAYRWGAANKNGGAKANAEFAKWLNRQIVWAEDFEPTDRWDNNIDGGSWQLNEWSSWKKEVPGRRLILSIPLLPGGWDLKGPKSGIDAGKPVSLENGAKGEYNKHFKKLAENLVKAGLEDSILRLGWEFNGGWYNWRTKGHEEAFAGYWREIVKTMRAVPGAEKLQFNFNPTCGHEQFPSEKAWPGDEYVDQIGVDVYDQCWQADTYPIPEGASQEEIMKRRKKAWDYLLNGNHGLKFWVKFAADHKKQMTIPEWGIFIRADKHGGGDNPFFIEQMHKFIMDPANNVYFHCYFDVEAGDGKHQLSPGLNGKHATEFPQSSAKFRELFSNPANPETK